MTEQDVNQLSRKVTSGPIIRTIFSLALPVIAGMAMEVALSVTDFYWVGRLGTSAQDAITSAMVIIWTIFAAVTIISIGITALVSRYIGANDTERAVYYIRQALWLALLISSVLTVLGFWITPDLLSFMHADTVTMAHAIPYLRIFFASAMLLFFMETLYAVFRASGDTRTPTKVGITVVCINLVLDPILIFGLGPIPPMGVAGAGLATGISYLYGALVILRYLRKGKLGYRVDKILASKPIASAMAKIAGIGLPIATQQLAFVMVYWFLIRFVHEFGSAAGAAMGIGNRMETFSYLTCYGISLAASTMVGQNLGAGQPERAAKCAWGATGIGIGLALIFSIFFIAMPRQIASIFSADPAVVNMAVDYLVILGLSQFTMAVEIILEGSFSGSGDTIPPMLVMIPGSAARIPLAYYLTFELGWGLSGIWWTLTITTTLKALVLAWWFKRGHWKTKKV